MAPLSCVYHLEVIRLRQLFFALSLSLTALFAAPISTYYLTAGDNGANIIIQGGVATVYAQQYPGNGGEYAIAVDSTVRTLSNGNSGAGTGAQYDLGFSFTGTSYTYPTPSYAFYDGTTDGAYNYSVDYSAGGVYRMGLDWSNPVLLFQTPSSYLGITYDPGNSSLWVSGFGSDTVMNVTMAGALLSSFNTGFSSISSLALDPADGTLWMGSQNTQGTFYQFSRAGALLGTSAFENLIQYNTLGGEFSTGGAAVPEPSTWAMMGLGLAAAALARKRR